MGLIDCITKSGLASDSQLEELKKRLAKGESDEKLKKDFINDYHKQLSDELNEVRKKFGQKPESYTSISEPNLENVNKKFDIQKEKLNQEYKGIKPPNEPPVNETSAEESSDKVSGFG